MLSSLTKNDNIIKVSKCEVKTIEYPIRKILQKDEACYAKPNGTFIYSYLPKCMKKAVFLMASLSRAMWW